MLSLVIPAYNERNRIGRTIVEYRDTLRKNGIDFEIIVEMDGCTDGTQEVVKRLSERIPELRYIEFDRRLGKGRGLKEGFKVTRGDIVGFVDADGSVPPQEFVRMVRELEKGYDVVIASRRAKGAKVRNQPTVRRILSKCFNIYVRTLFGIPYRDTQCGAKVFRRYVLEKVFEGLNSNGFAFDVNLLYLVHRAGFRVKELGVEWTDMYGSKVNVPKAVVEMGLDVLRLRLYHSPLRPLIWRRRG